MSHCKFDLLKITKFIIIHKHRSLECLRFLRHDGLPIVNVFNASYPNFTWVYQPIDYEENFLSDGLQQRLTIHPRQPSSSVIFGVVFFLEDAARIQQQVSTTSQF
jgi:hypothetical protein